MENLNEISAQLEKQNSELKRRVYDLQEQLHKETLHTKQILPRYRESLQKLKENSQIMREKIKQLEEQRAIQRDEFKKQEKNWVGKLKKVKLEYENLALEQSQNEQKLQDLIKSHEAKRKQQVEELNYTIKVLQNKIQQYQRLMDEQEQQIGRLQDDMQIHLSGSKKKLSGSGYTIQSSQFSPFRGGKNQKDDLEFYLTKSPSDPIFKSQEKRNAVGNSQSKKSYKKVFNEDKEKRISMLNREYEDDYDFNQVSESEDEKRNQKEKPNLYNEIQKQKPNQSLNNSYNKLRDELKAMSSGKKAKVKSNSASKKSVGDFIKKSNEQVIKKEIVSLDEEIEMIKRTLAQELSQFNSESQSNTDQNYDD